MTEGTARVPLLPIADAKAAAEGVGVNELAAELSVFRVWLNHPTLAKWLGDLIMGLIFQGKLDTRLRELIIMRLGWITSSDYEWTQHWRIAVGLKVSEADLLGVRDWQSYAGFGPAEHAVLAATDETVATGTISDATWAGVRAHVSDDDQVLLEVVSAIGVWRMVSSILRSLNVPLEDGITSWPPDGQPPA